MAYPGSRLYSEAVAQGAALPQSWTGYSQYSYDCRPLDTRRLSGGQVLAFRDYAFHAYFQNPRYLNMIGRKFGAETAAQVVQMAEKRLPRQHAVY
jgi:hypothetical protein